MRALSRGLLSALCCVACVWNTGFSKEGPEKVNVAVSIVPQKYFVERIGGSRVDVLVMVPPGFSPATYEPLPRQMANLTGAQIYFRIGVPFEDAWLKRISSLQPAMKIDDTRAGIF